MINRQQELKMWITGIDFRSGSYHIVFLDPNEVDFEGLANLPHDCPGDRDLIFIPLIPRNKERYMRDNIADISFESWEALHAWVDSIKPSEKSK